MNNLALNETLNDFAGETMIIDNQPVTSDIVTGYNSEETVNLIYVKPEDLLPSKYNDFSLEGIKELRDSIRNCGLRHPLDVKPMLNGKYLLLSGNRRRLAILNGMEAGYEWFSSGIPCTVNSREIKDVLDERITIVGSMEWIQRYEN